MSATPPTIATAGGHRVTLLPDCALLLDRFDAAVARAARRIFVECYIVRDDVLGRWLAERLVAAAARGVDVRLLYDPLGSQKADPAHFERLAAAGVAVKPYWAHHAWLPKAAPFPRDHGRVIVVDDVAITGGAAWADEWLPVERGGQGWHDVSVEVEGPVVEDFARLFTVRWDEAGQRRFGADDYDTDQRFPELRLIGDTPRRLSLVFEEHMKAINEARRRVWLANAYFWPPRVMDEALVAAVRRGVDVRVILPVGSDLPIVERAARAEHRGWLRRGLKLHAYRRRMMHAKYAVIDDAWSTVGTFNVLPVSVGLANEVNLFVCDPAFVAEVAAQFERDVAASEPIELGDLDGRSFVGDVADDLASDLMRVTDFIWGPPKQAPAGAPIRRGGG